MKNREVHINYQGGNGGFFALWIILLCTDFRCKFEGTSQDLDAVMKTHWNINSSKWKESEVWPNNKRTKESNLNKKLYLHCNPSNDTISEQKGIKVTTYNLIEMQYALCNYKKANFFYQSEADEINQTRSANVKKKIENGNVDVLGSVDELIKKSDISVRWQDLIRTDGECLLSKLGYSTNEKCRRFVKQYVNLHPQHIQELIEHG